MSATTQMTHPGCLAGRSVVVQPDRRDDIPDLRVSNPIHTPNARPKLRQWSW